MKVIVYAKSAVNLYTKEGTYSFTFVRDGERTNDKRKFKNKVLTLTAADCAAYVNALYILSDMVAAKHITELEVITDSSKVEQLLTIYKAEKHCEEYVRFYREKVLPVFRIDIKITVRKIPSKPISGDTDTFILQGCLNNARNELNIINEITK